MKRLIPVFCLIAVATFMSCKDKNAKASDNQELPGHVLRPGSIDPQSTAGRLGQATAAAEESNLVWAGNKDVVCGMSIERDVTDTVHYAGKIYGFCAESCKETFQENPQKWLSQK